MNNFSLYRCHFSPSQIMYLSLTLVTVCMCVCVFYEMLSDDNKKLQFLRSITVVLCFVFLVVVWFVSAHLIHSWKTHRWQTRDDIIDEHEKDREEKKLILKLMELINFSHAIKASPLTKWDFLDTVLILLMAFTSIYFNK